MQALNQYCHHSKLLVYLELTLTLAKRTHSYIKSFIQKHTHTFLFYTCSHLTDDDDIVVAVVERHSDFLSGYDVYKKSKYVFDIKYRKFIFQIWHVEEIID